MVQKMLIMVFVVVILLGGICWAQETGVSNEQSGKITDKDGNAATYIPNKDKAGGGRIEYRYHWRDLWHTTYVNISKAQEKEILAKAKKGEKIPEKLVPVAIYYFNKGLLVGNSTVGSPLDDGDRFVEGWRVLLALGRQEDRINKTVAKENENTQKTVMEESQKTRSEMQKQSGVNQITTREENQLTRDFLGAKIDDLPGVLFFAMCVIIGAIIIFGRRNS